MARRSPLRAAHLASATEILALGGVSADRLATILAELAPGGTRTFLEDEAIDLLTVVGLEFPDVAVAHDPAEAAQLAGKLGFPVVVKALAPGLGTQGGRDRRCLDAGDRRRPSRRRSVSGRGRAGSA